MDGSDVGAKPASARSRSPHGGETENFNALHRGVIHQRVSCEPETPAHSLDFRTRRLALRDRDQEIAAVRHGDADGDVVRFVRHLQIVGAERPDMSAIRIDLARPQAAQSAD